MVQEETRGSLPVENGESMPHISFKHEKGCFLKYCTVFILIILYVASIIATGVLVHFFWSPPVCSKEIEIVQHVQHPEAKTHYDSIVKKDDSLKTITDDKAMEGDAKDEAVSTAAPKEPAVSAESMMEAKKKNASVDMRLPQSVNPLHYYVRLIPYINGNFSIDGYMELTFEVLEPTMNLTLHIRAITTRNETIKVVPESEPDGVSLPIRSHTFDKEREFYIAKFDQELKKGEKYIIKMGYEAYLNDNYNGFYRSSYKDEMGKTRWLAVTQFQATRARQAFPCMDEPGFKSSFTIELGREKTMSSLSNTPLNKTIPMDGHSGWVWDQYEKSVEMSTYLVAFAVSDFTHISATNKSTPYDFRVWTRESAISQANYSLEIGLKATEFFEKFFHVPFPLPKQDSIAIPDKGGAMENWGLVTYGEAILLHDPKTSSASEKLVTAHVIVHEIAHQWFGNLVTPAWWTDLWLNEGFASYMEFVGLNTVEPTFRSDEMVIKDMHVVFPMDALESSRPINVVVRNPSEISGIFDRITYQKGSSIIRMMSHFLTEETFRKGLSNYLTELSYKTAVQDDLWRYLTKQAHEDVTLSKELTVKKVMDTWTLQMGYPVITVKKSRNGTTTIEQERFLLTKNSVLSHDYKWWVPITYATQSNPDFTSTQPKKWMSPSESKIAIENIPYEKWVIFNTQQTGYYRVNYEEENWKKIIRQLMVDHTVINTVNRAQLIDDSMALARAGRLPYETAFKILTYLKKETEYVPWKAALDSLKFIEDMFSFTGGYGALKEFLHTLIQPAFAKLSFTDSLAEPLPKQLLRAEILLATCSLGCPHCTNESVQLFKQWMDDPDNEGIISPNLKHAVYCTAIAEGGYKEWSFLWKTFKNSIKISEKRILLDALGCSKQSWILSGYLKKAFTKGTGIRKHEARLVVRYLSAKPSGRLLVWEFFKNNWEHFRDYYGSPFSSWRSIFTASAESLNTENEIKELKQFVGYFGSGERATLQAIENAENNLQWMKNSYQEVMNWLTENGYTNAV